MNEKKKYLFVYLKTGGGHLAPARALFNYMNKHHPEIADPKLIYAFEKSPRWIQYIIEDGYRKLQYKGKWFFEFLYAMNKLPLIARITCVLLAPFMTRYLKEVIINEKPDKIVVFHFFCIIPVYRILRKNKLSIPVQTLITDPFTPHPMWFLLKNQNFIVFSKKLEERIIRKKRGCSVKSFPFILDEKFSKLPSAEEIQSYKLKHNYSIDKKVILIFGGGDGIPKGEKILNEILKSNLNAEIGIVCGKNETLRKAAEKTKSKYKSIYIFIDKYCIRLINHKS